MVDAFDGRITELTAAFTKRLAAELDMLEKFGQELENSAADAAMFDRVCHVVHRLAGSSRVFGFGELTAPAQEVETLIANKAAPERIAEGTRQLADDIRRSISH
ncbi:Hpt domain-containing protein [Roseibium aggregatum]|uniref:Hpt domain-containing protein n=1 Tax=Roseibium aggregatum TaxID=187304 RepID=A0A926S915_9HYPH|nr:Hpt domain-containing protein [Roseibium aggregatum]MBD1549697.1 Hpt domain-containing protein [Roseibium aggregatum]